MTASFAAWGRQSNFTGNRQLLTPPSGQTWNRYFYGATTSLDQIGPWAVIMHSRIAPMPMLMLDPQQSIDVPVAAHGIYIASFILVKSHVMTFVIEVEHPALFQGPCDCMGC